MSDVRRTDIGFQGGQVLSLRASDKAYDKLMAALADDKAGRWHTLDTEEERIQIDLATVVYVQRDTGDQKVGF